MKTLKEALRVSEALFSRKNIGTDLSMYYGKDMYEFLNDFDKDFKTCVSDTKSLLINTSSNEDHSIYFIVKIGNSSEMSRFGKILSKILDRITPSFLEDSWNFFNKEYIVYMVYKFKDIYSEYPLDMGYDDIGVLENDNIDEIITINHKKSDYNHICNEIKNAIEKW